MGDTIIKNEQFLGMTEKGKKNSVHEHKEPLKHESLWEKSAAKGGDGRKTKVGQTIAGFHTSKVTSLLNSQSQIQGKEGKGPQEESDRRWGNEKRV